MKQRYIKLIIVFCILLIFLGGILAYIYIPPYSYAHQPHYSPRLGIAENKVPDDYVNLMADRYYDDDGFQNDSVIYVKEGSIHPLAYWQRFITGEQSPTHIRYVKYSAKEALEYWTKFQTILESNEYAPYSFRFTGDLLFDEELGYRVFLIVDGENADFIRSEIEQEYGDFVIFDSEKYTESYFKSQDELLTGCYWQTRSIGFTN